MCVVVDIDVFYHYVGAFQRKNITARRWRWRRRWRDYFERNGKRQIGHPRRRNRLLVRFNQRSCGNFISAKLLFLRALAHPRCAARPVTPIVLPPPPATDEFNHQIGDYAPCVDSRAPYPLAFSASQKKARAK